MYVFEKVLKIATKRAKGRKTGKCCKIDWSVCAPAQRVKKVEKCQSKSLAIRCSYQK